MLNFTVRTEKPSNDNRYYIKNLKKYGGLSDCILGNVKLRETEGSTLPNCVGYAVGRFNEISGEIRKKEKWYWKYLNNSPNNILERAKKIKLKYGNEPKPGSLLVWNNKKSGHIAFVEKVIDDNNIIITESSYSRYAFMEREINNNNGNWSSNNTFQCFIYNPDVKEIEEEKPIEQETTKEYKVGDIVVFVGSTHYPSPNATKGYKTKGGKAKITLIKKGKAHPLHLIHIDKSSNVYGWVNESDISE